MRQEHAAEAGGRPRAPHPGPHPGARPGGDRAVPGRGLRLPAAGAPALAQRARQRPLLGGDAGPRPAPVPEAGGRCPGADRARRLRDQVPARALRRHAAAGGIRPRPAARPEPRADGRARRRLRRADPGGDEPGAAADLGGAAQDHPLRHPFDPGGHPARRPRGRDDAAARPGGARDHGEPPPPAHHGPRVRPALQGPQRRGARPDLLGAQGATVRAVRRLLGETLIPATTLLAALLVWEVATRALRIPRFIMPAPSAILGEGWEWRYRFIGHTWVTLYETLGGFALSMVVGVPLAVLIVYSPALRAAIYPLVILPPSVPKIAIAPVLLLALGYGEVPKMVVAFLVAFFPVVVATATRLAAPPPALLDLSRSYRASAFKTFVKVRLPMALPFIFAGAKVAITLSVIGAVVGEFVGSDKGLGYVILSSTSHWKTEVAFSAMILLSLMAIVLFAAVSLVERVVCPWLNPQGEG